MSTTRMIVSNSNGSGAGSFRAAIDAVTTGPANISFSAAGTIPITTTRLTVDGPHTHIDGGNKVVEANNTNITGGAYSTIVDSNGFTIKNMHFDNSGGGDTGSTILFGNPSSTSSTLQRTSGLVRNCYFRGPPGLDDTAWVDQRYRTIMFEYCIFESASFGAFVSAYQDNVGPGYRMPWRIILRHCILIGLGRIPDIHGGDVDILGCIIQRMQTPGQISADARVNFINNWFLNPSDVSYNTSTIAINRTAATNGNLLEDNSIYSSGNYQDGVPEASWVATSYAPTFYTDPFGVAADTRVFRSRPWGSPLYVPDGSTSRNITLKLAGPAVKSVHCLQAIGNVVSRRPQAP